MSYVSIISTIGLIVKIWLPQYIYIIRLITSNNRVTYKLTVTFI